MNISLSDAQNMVSDIPKAVDMGQRATPLTSGGSGGSQIATMLTYAASERRTNKFLDEIAQQPDISYQDFIKQAARAGVINNPRVLAYSELLKEKHTLDTHKKLIDEERSRSVTNEQQDYDKTKSRAEQNRIELVARNKAGLDAASKGLTPQEQYSQGIQGGADEDVAAKYAMFQQQIDEIKTRAQVNEDANVPRPAMGSVKDITDEMDKTRDDLEKAQNALAHLKGGLDPVTKQPLNKMQKGTWDSQILDLTTTVAGLKRNYKVLEAQKTNFNKTQGTKAEQLLSGKQAEEFVASQEREQVNKAKIKAEQLMLELWKNKKYNGKKEFTENYIQSFGVSPKFGPDGNPIAQFSSIETSSIAPTAVGQTGSARLTTTAPQKKSRLSAEDEAFLDSIPGLK